MFYYFYHCCKISVSYRLHVTTDLIDFIKDTIYKFTADCTSNNRSSPCNFNSIQFFSIQDDSRMTDLKILGVMPRMTSRPIHKSSKKLFTRHLKSQREVVVTEVVISLGRQFHVLVAPTQKVRPPRVR